MKYFFITTPIFYGNANLHIGHLYTCVLADIFTRYQKEFENSFCYFITGIDEHGKKIINAANKEKKTYISFVNEKANKMQEIWKLYDINYDKFIRTTSKSHHQTVQNIIQKLIQNNYIFFDKYESYYCLYCEEYFTKFKAKENNYLCFNCSRKINIQKECNYYLNTKSNIDFILRLWKSFPNMVKPIWIQKELKKNFLNNDFQNFLIARKETEWGIIMPNNNNYSVYVWFDALCNYLSAVGEYNDLKFKNLNIWNTNKYTIFHLLSKEISRFHCLYFLIILKILKKKYKNVNFLIHGWILFDNEKLSKSKHVNIMNLKKLNNLYPSDLIRFFLIYNHNIHNDFNYSLLEIQNINNSLLVNKIGNLYHRIIGILTKNNFLITEISKKFNLNNEPYTKKFIKWFDKYKVEMQGWNFNIAIDIIIEFVNYLNKSIEINKPWQFSQNNNKDNLKELLLEWLLGLKFITKMLFPFLIKSYQRIITFLNFDFTKFDGYLNIKFNNLNKWTILFKIIK